MAIVASAHVLLAVPLLPAVEREGGVTGKRADLGGGRVVENKEVPVVAEVMTTGQLAGEPPPVQVDVGMPAKLPGRLVMLAVPEPLPNVVPTAVTVMVSV